MAWLTIELDDASWQLLAAVAAGRVRRHRMKAWVSPRIGEEWETTPDAGTGICRANKRLAPLRREGLVELPDGDLTAESWPWQLTKLGELVLAAYRKNGGTG